MRSKKLKSNSSIGGVSHLSGMLLLLSPFSHVRLCVTPQTAAHQAPPSLGFSRQKHWSGLPFPSPMHESEKWKVKVKSCPTPSDPMNCSPTGPSVHGIFQARVLEWVVIAFSWASLISLLCWIMAGKHGKPVGRMCKWWWIQRADSWSFLSLCSTVLRQLHLSNFNHPYLPEEMKAYIHTKILYNLIPSLSILLYT